MISRSKKTNERTNEKSGVIHTHTHTQTRPGEKERERERAPERLDAVEWWRVIFSPLSCSFVFFFFFFYVFLYFTWNNNEGRSREKKIRMSQKNSNQFFSFSFSFHSVCSQTERTNERTGERERERREFTDRKKALGDFFFFLVFHVLFLLHIRPTISTRLPSFRLPCVCMCGPFLDWLHEKCFPFSPQKKTNKTKREKSFFCWFCFSFLSMDWQKIKRVDWSAMTMERWHSISPQKKRKI